MRTPEATQEVAGPGGRKAKNKCVEVGVIYETPPLSRHAQDQKERRSPQLLLGRMLHTHMAAFVGCEGLVSVYLTQR